MKLASLTEEREADFLCALCVLWGETVFSGLRRTRLRYTQILLDLNKLIEVL